jgi:DNA invertase Pin-like site-specific DNA recombinase
VPSIEETKRIFVERGESAKSADRTQFQAMFSHLAQAAKRSISHVLVYKFDRFSRNVEDGAMYRVQLRQLGIDLTSATEKTDNTPSGRFLTTVLSAKDQLDNDTRAERTLAGMKATLEKGRWQWPAPTGYLSGTKLGPSFVVDKQRGHLIARMFELVATGEHTKASETVETAFIELLESLTPKRKQMELIERVFRNAWAGRIQTATTDATALRSELSKQRARKKRVLEQMADGDLSKEDFKSLNASTVEAIADLEQRLSFAESDVLDIDSAIEHLTHLLWNTAIIWQTSDLQGKKKIQRRMFPEGLAYSKNGFGTLKIKGI